MSALAVQRILYLIDIITLACITLHFLELASIACMLIFKWTEHVRGREDAAMYDLV